MAGGGQPAALDGGQVAAHAIHFADGGAAAKQRAAHGLFHIERQSFCGQRQQRRTAAGNQAQDQIILAQASYALEHLLRGMHSCRVRHGMCGFDDIDVLAGHGIAIARHHQAAERTRPILFYGARHGRRGLAGADDDESAARRGGKVRRDAYRRLSRGNGGMEHLPQQ